VVKTLGDHVWLEAETLEQKILGFELFNNLLQNNIGPLVASFDTVSSVHKNFRLDDWNETGVLAASSISCKRVSNFHDVLVRWASVGLIDLDDGSPLGESNSHFVVFLGLVWKVVETLSGNLTESSGNFLESNIDFNSWKNTSFIEKLNVSFSSILISGSGGLVEHDSS
jgi:hypothetical protein